MGQRNSASNRVAGVSLALSTAASTRSVVNDGFESYKGGVGADKARS